MKKVIAILFSSLITINTSFALGNTEIPDEMYIKEHWISLTTSYDIETKTRKLGTLYRKFLSLMLTYEFFDPFDNKLAYARSKFFSLTAHFDVYDNYENFLGSADEKLFAFFPTFDIYGQDGYTKLAKASMNFWGTTFTIYDPVTDKEMATLYRPFFRLKNDWTFNITNRALFNRKEIDSRVLMTVIAFQGDREYWESNNQNYLRGVTKKSTQANEVTSGQVNELLEKIGAISKQEGLENIGNPNPKTIDAIASELEESYKELHAPDESIQTSKEKLAAFSEYCLSLAQSNALTREKKKAILFLLKARLEGAVNLM
ncbi:hypothetical protein [Legionella parisiensis]|uniref:Imelysin-like domain-containing protein n=1 Tax=Legionella parisiensis TaxID=45071 RepID=A0A1E5JW62_9GAMM|nr:hypothetical protein [Legionella parisiensis]KTD40005.1 hypothetical protein Lpar_1322 [Legionella parisiensis]OEH48759.1 hypothetical protein lpari_00159 [Legionella parisiensis]STX77451.1 Uncharacterised protein [Legionella parisiensis]